MHYLKLWNWIRLHKGRVLIENGNSGTSLENSSIYQQNYTAVVRKTEGKTEVLSHQN